jgi:hypothetical protein
MRNGSGRTICRAPMRHLDAALGREPGCPAAAQPWPTGAAGCMAARALGRGRPRGLSALATRAGGTGSGHRTRCASGASSRPHGGRSAAWLLRYAGSAARGRLAGSDGPAGPLACLILAHALPAATGLRGKCRLAAGTAAAASPVTRWSGVSSRSARPGDAGQGCSTTQADTLSRLCPAPFR